MSTKHEYTNLDAAILAAIEADAPLGFVAMQHIGSVKLHSEALEVAERDKNPKAHNYKPAWRFVDSRLQALRKAGKISFQRKPEGWVLSGPEARKP